MDRCETCRHWLVVEGEWDVSAGGLRMCAAVQPKWVVEDRIPKELKKHQPDLWNLPEGRLSATEEAWRAATEAQFKAAQAVVNDGSGYHAVLLTRPEFGCVLHEREQEKNADPGE